MHHAYVQVYTGNGKGKTTAALGLTLRAAGAGMRVFFSQFLKGADYSELAGLQRFDDLVTIRQFGEPGFIRGNPTEADMAAGRAGLKCAAEALTDGSYHVVVLDEAALACKLGIIETPELLEAIQNRAPGVEVIITGRNAPEELIQAADLVTEMREIKHYFSRGVAARKGIEK